MPAGKYQKWLNPDGLLLLEAWARDGLTDEIIATKISISASTLYEWKNKYPEISEALKRGKEIVDTQVENALLKRALGYSYNEDKYAIAEMDDEEYYLKQKAFVNEYKFNHPETTQDEIDIAARCFSKTKSVLVERKVKEVIPDTTAQIFWLKNRKPAQWRDKRDIENVSSDSADAPKLAQAIKNMSDVWGDEE